MRQEGNLVIVKPAVWSGLGVFQANTQIERKLLI